MGWGARAAHPSRVTPSRQDPEGERRCRPRPPPSTTAIAPFSAPWPPAAARLTGFTLVVDGLCFADQFTGPRLTAAGLIAAGAGPARLTPSGHALLAAA